jgi:FkbM family methyltransferase
MLSKEERQAVIDLFPFMGERPIVFDVGANKSHWADVVLDEFKENCEIHLFEPNKKLLSFCQIKHEYKTNVFYHEVGLLDHNGRKEFHFFENFNNELSSFHHGKDKWIGLPVKSEMVEVRCGDDVFSTLSIPKIDYLKIDCEGSDLLTLRGFDGLLKNNGIGIVQIEYSEHWERGSHTFSELKKFAEKYEYKVYRYIDDNFWEVKESNPPHDNYFITKFEIHNYCIAGSNAHFRMNIEGLTKMNLVIEIGAMEGVTTKYICENMLNDSGEARVIVVDPLRDYYVTDDPRYHPEFKHQYQRFKRNTRGLPVDLKRGESEHELPKLHALRADMVYVDGNHYSPWPYHDLCWGFAITKTGGFILADDYNIWAEETKQSIDKFLEEFRGHYEIVHSNYQILIRKTSNHYNSITESYYL